MRPRLNLAAPSTSKAIVGHAAAAQPRVQVLELIVRFMDEILEMLRLRAGQATLQLGAHAAASEVSSCQWRDAVLGSYAIRLVFST
jgi:hypothetical protein